jgi:hypothetical protein
LSRILLYLPAVQQNFQPARLLRQFEQTGPFILGQGRLFGKDSGGVFRFPLLLPGGDFGLLARELALVVLVIV